FFYFLLLFSEKRTLVGAWRPANRALQQCSPDCRAPTTWRLQGKWAQCGSQYAALCFRVWSGVVHVHVAGRQCNDVPAVVQVLSRGVGTESITESLEVSI
ncbi:hypothetical protein M758_UG221400, partial [Ceratodon purpureus]